MRNKKETDKQEWTRKSRLQLHVMTSSLLMSHLHLDRNNVIIASQLCDWPLTNQEEK